MRIMILGGYGVFGGRLVHLLSDLPTVEMLVCGRSKVSAHSFCAAYRGQAAVRAMVLDRRDIVSGLAAERPDLVVDASGPFQGYGRDGYGVISACIAAGVDYLDFADAADFVVGVAQFDAQARDAGVFILSGASSFPVLTAAVLREMSKTIDIRVVHGRIAPSPHAGIGLNVMRAVIGYAGAPVKLRRGSKDSHATGLAESMRFTIVVPGRMPLQNIHFSLVDVPDLQVIPPRYPAMTDIWMGAGPVPEVLHRMLNFLAKARARWSLPSLVPLARLFYAVLNLMRFGEHRGGMFVRVRGFRDGKTVERSWHLLAEGDDGPFIPSMAIEAIIRNMLAGKKPPPGARAATDVLDLADYDALFVGRAIFTGFRDTDDEVGLYPALLGEAFRSLPAAVRDLHDTTMIGQFSGTAEVRRGTGLIARLVAGLIGFPRPGMGVPVHVTLAREGQGERWTRTFGTRKFSSFQSLGRRRDEGLLVERFGILSVALALVVEDDRLYLIPRRWAVLGIPLPRSLMPAGKSFETEVEGQFRFDVEISAPPLVGLIVAYRGTLERVESPL